MQVAFGPSVKRFIEILQRRRRVAVLGGLVALLCAIATPWLLPPSYMAASHVLLVNEAQGRDPSDAGSDLPAIASSSEVVDRVRRKLNLSDSVSEIRKRLSAHVAPRESIMTISYRDSSPYLAVSVPNAVADVFTAYYSGLAAGRYDPVISRLRADLAAKKVSIHDLEQTIERRAAESSYSGSGQSLDDVAKRIGDLQTQRAIANAQLVSDVVQLNAVRTQRRISGAVRHETLGSSQAYDNVKTDIVRDEADLASMRARYTDRYPGLQGMDAKVREENAAVDRYARLEADKQAATVAGDRALVDALDQELGRSHAQLNNLSPSSMSVGELRALRDAAEAQYQAVAQRLSNAEANSAEASALGTVIVVDRAMKAESSLVGLGTFLTVAMLAVIALAIAAAYIAEAVDPRFISKNDVESICGQRVLGRVG
jgi:uncharacterized protein involved in exopolysaccharide biosynthesis